MTTGQKVWRAVVEPVFHEIFSLVEKRRLRQSFARIIILGYGRDSLRYYENGRWVTVEAELMCGRADVDRVVYRGCPLKWNDAGELLTPDQREKLFQKVGEYLDEAKIKWKFSDAGPS